MIYVSGCTELMIQSFKLMNKKEPNIFTFLAETVWHCCVLEIWPRSQGQGDWK